MNTEKCSPEVDIEPIKCKKRNRKTVKLLNNSFALYVLLYCRRKDSKSLKHTCKMIEAAKSWLTLNEFEKQKFDQKFKEYQQKYSDAFINCLQKSKPFMKRKVSSTRTKKNDVNINGHLKLDEEKNELNLPHLESEHFEEYNVEINGHLKLDEEKNESNLPHLESEHFEEYDVENKEENEISGIFDEFVKEDIDDACYEADTLKQSKISYPEPIAPNLISGKELFEIVRSNTESKLTWSTLPQRDRSVYNQAILVIKKDYIHKYKLYLENLTEKELFEHYNKCF